MFAWSFVVAAYWMTYCTRTGEHKHIAFVLAATYTIHHLMFDLLYYSPGYIYYPTCAIADLLICITLKNSSYISSIINRLLLLSALLNLAGFGVYVAELSNLFYNLSIVLCHAGILYFLHGERNGRRYY